MIRVLMFFIVLSVLLWPSCRNEQNSYIPYVTNDSFPVSLKNEHQWLLSRFEKIIDSGKTNDSVSTQLKEVLTHHFSEEEIYVWPLLDQLINADNLQDSIRDKLITSGDKLQEQLLHLNAEHQFIKALLNEWQYESDTVINEFINDLHQHALVEEEIYYPAALMVGKYLKTRKSTHK